MKIKISDVRQTLVKIILNRSELSKEDADTLALDYLEGELCGRKSHGVAAFLAMAEKLSGASATFKIIKETDSFLYVDAQGSLGAVIGRKLADKVSEKAHKQGVGVAVVRDMKTWLRPAAIAQYLARKDLVTWVVNTGGLPMVTPPGGREPVIGTNPIGIGIPTGAELLIVDMATSSRAWGEVRLAQKLSHQLPEHSFVDSEGRPTLDPDAAYAALPMGGYKGFGLGLFIEVLGGSLAGMHMGKGDSSEDYRTRTRGAFIMAINPAMTVGTEQFKQDNADFIASIKQSPVAKDSDRVTLPGDRATKTKKANEAQGYLEIDDELWHEITVLL